MARKKDTPQKAALREMMGNYLKENNVTVKDGTNVNSIMRDMMSIILEGALDQEMDEELGYSKYDYRNKETDNSRNGHSQKTMHTSYGDMEIDIPRDRKGEFEPQIVKKYQNTVTQDMEEKIISMYAKGMTTNDIESHMRELYDIEISDSTISRITDKILPIVKEWQERPLEEIYAVVFMDAIHYHVRNEGRIVKRAVYIAIGIDMEGHKDVLGMYVGQNESAKFWLSILNGLKNRGVEDILIACVDGLTGFPQAIEAVFPDTGRVGKRRLTISLWQVCADPSQNRACTSQCTRLAVVLLDYIFFKSMMNLLVAIVTHHHCFSAFCNHNYFPRFFSFQIFHLVHMMHFVFSVFSLITT